MQLDILNIIHLPGREDRRQSFLEQMSQQKIPFKVWDGIVHELPFTGISRSHKRIVQFAKDNNIPRCMIAEDDVAFTCPRSWKTYCLEIPDDYDLYFGGISGGEVDEESRTVINSSGLFMYTIHERFYDAFLAADESKNLDRFLSGIGLEATEMVLGRKPIYKVCYPIIATCIDGISNNSMQFVEHEKYFIPYKKLC